MEPAPTACLCCGGARLRKLGEDITETLEVIPRRWKVIQHLREKCTCRDCEAMSQPPAPFHVTPRGWAGPSLLAMIKLRRPAKPPERRRGSHWMDTVRRWLGGSTVRHRLASLASLYETLPLYIKRQMSITSP